MKIISLAVTALLVSTSAIAGTTVQAQLKLATVDGAGAAVGDISLSDGPDGARIAYDLHGLPPGPHGFHVHDKGSCEPGPNKDGKVIAAGAAGGHFDPSSAGKHLGPMGAGHAGDLPLITIDATGAAKGVVVAPHLMSVAALKGHAIMLHAGGDNYSDDPAPLGGGGARLSCGVIQ